MSKKPDYNPPVFGGKEFETFKVAISQTVPFDLAFGTMTVTDYELLVQTIYVLNKLIDVTNAYTLKIDEVLEWLTNEGISESVVIQLNIWKDDGTLEDLINEALFESKLDKITFDEFLVNFAIYKGEVGQQILDVIETQETVNLSVGQYLDELSTNKVDISTFTDFKNDVDEILEPLNKEINGNYLLVGDSYLVGRSGSGGGTIDGWGKYFARNLGLTIGENCFELGENSMGFVRPGQSGNTFLTKLQTFTGDKNKVSKIIVGGGHNDRVSNYTECSGAVKVFVDYAKTNFPNAKIYVSFMAGNIVANKDNATIRTTLFREILQAYGSDFRTINIDAWQVLKDGRNLSNDGYHPNEIGYKSLGKYLVESIFGRPFYFPKHHSINYQTKFTGNAQYFTIIQNDNVFNLNVSPNSLQVSGTSVLNQGGYDFYRFIDDFPGLITGTGFPFTELICNLRGVDILLFGVSLPLRYHHETNSLLIGIPSADDTVITQVIINAQSITIQASEFCFTGGI